MFRRSDYRYRALKLIGATILCLAAGACGPKPCDANRHPCAKHLSLANWCTRNGGCTILAGGRTSKFDGEVPRIGSLLIPFDALAPDIVGIHDLLILSSSIMTATLDGVAGVAQTNQDGDTYLRWAPFPGSARVLEIAVDWSSVWKGGTFPPPYEFFDAACESDYQTCGL